MACASCGGSRSRGAGTLASGKKVVYVTAPRDAIDEYDPELTYPTEAIAKKAAPDGHIARAIVQ